MQFSAGWQEDMARDVASLVCADTAALALAVVGSGAHAGFDAWSDLDLLLVVEEQAFARFFPAYDWLALAGDVYTFDQSRNEFRAVTRLCFTDLRRLDLIITTGSAIAQWPRWPRLPFAAGSRLLFSRTAAMDALLAGTFPAPPPQFSAEAFAELFRGFWFKGVVAVQKVVRGDLLVAQHLALEMRRDCCTLALAIRDRDGHAAPITLAAAAAIKTLGEIPAEFETSRIFDTIERAGDMFDDLALRWSPDRQAGRGPLREWVAAARRDLAAVNMPNV